MRAAYSVAFAALVAGCQAGSYIEPSFVDAGGNVASEITDVLVRRHGVERSQVWIVEPEQSEHPFAATVPASVQGAGFGVSPEGAPLLYYVTTLYDGVLLRVQYLGDWTARFFRRSRGELSVAGPATLRKGG